MKKIVWTFFFCATVNMPVVSVRIHSWSVGFIRLQARYKRQLLSADDWLQSSSACMNGCKWQNCSLCGRPMARRSVQSKRSYSVTWAAILLHLTPTGKSRPCMAVSTKFPPKVQPGSSFGALIFFYIPQNTNPAPAEIAQLEPY